MTIFLIILTLLFPFIFKYQYIITNQFTQIPIINSILDPAYLTNDWYVIIGRGFGPRTIFAYYMAFLAKLMTIPGSFFLNYLIYIFLLTWSAFQLTQMLFRDKIVSFITTLFVLFGTTYSLGGNILVTKDFSASQLPLALILTAIVLLLKRKVYLSLIMSVLAAYLHPLLGWEGGSIILATYSIYLCLIRNSKTALRQIFSVWIIFILLNLPLILTYLTEFGSGGSGVNSQVLINILAYSRNPHHYIPSLWPLTDYIRFFLFLTVSFWAGLKLRPKLNRAAKNIFIQIIFIGTVIMIYNLIGLIFTEILPVYQIVVAQLFRNNLFIYFLAAVVFYGGILTLVKSGKLPPLILFILFLFNKPSFALVGKSDILALLFFLAAGVTFIKKRHIFAEVLLLSAFFLSNYHVGLHLTTSANQTPSLTNLTHWVKTNTPPDSVFIIPPEMEEFRFQAERAVIADWKAFPFQKSGMWEWYQRMCDLGNIKTCQNGLIRRETVINGYLTLTENDILRLAEKYNADYLITAVKYRSLNQVYFDNYFIYQLKNTE